MMTKELTATQPLKVVGRESQSELVRGPAELEQTRFATTGDGRAPRAFVPIR
jgi:hypothetical protein